MSIKKLGLFLLIGLMLSSCAHKRLIYLQEKAVEETEKEYTYKDSSYVIQPHDILYIQIRTFNEEVDKLFNQSRGGGGISNNNNRNIGSGGNRSSFYFNGYTVNDTGYIKVPIIGEMKIAGHTIPETQKIIEDMAEEYLQEANITVKFVSFNITFFGEFNSPGVQTFYQERVNVFEAVTKAGGISDYGDRDNVLVIRKLGKNRLKTFRIDLTDRNILGSDEFLLMPNDLVYVEPVRSRSFKIGAADFTFVLSTFSSTLSTILLIFTLNQNK
jgi:polysaccharide biosynthesis/export protein